MPETVHIRTGTIRLGQLLKLAGEVGGGGEAKALLASGGVLVNGEAETRRGRQLRAGDVIRVGERELSLAAAQASEEGGPPAASA